MRNAQLTQALSSTFTPEERARLLEVAPLLARLAETI
jgi:hypothetical protein